jgi:hypothetical protein
MSQIRRAQTPCSCCCRIDTAFLTPADGGRRRQHRQWDFQAFQTCQSAARGERGATPRKVGNLKAGGKEAGSGLIGKQPGQCWRLVPCCLISDHHVALGLWLVPLPCQASDSGISHSLGIFLKLVSGNDSGAFLRIFRLSVIVETGRGIGIIWRLKSMVVLLSARFSSRG